MLIMCGGICQTMPDSTQRRLFFAKAPEHLSR
jgi:hypothetical protein